MYNCIPPTDHTHHIWIVKVTGSSHLAEVSVILPIELNNGGHTGPGVLYIPIVPPDIAHLGYFGVVWLYANTKKRWTFI